MRQLNGFCTWRPRGETWQESWRSSLTKLRVTVKSIDLKRHNEFDHDCRTEINRNGTALSEKRLCVYSRKQFTDAKKRHPRRIRWSLRSSTFSLANLQPALEHPSNNFIARLFVPIAWTTGRSYSKFSGGARSRERGIAVERRKSNARMCTRTRPEGKTRSHALRGDAKRAMTIRRHARALSMSADRADSLSQFDFHVDDLSICSVITLLIRHVSVHVFLYLTDWMALRHFVNSPNTELFTVIP